MEKKNGNNIPHFSDFFFVIKNYFGSPSIALFNGNRTISVYDQILLIIFNWEVTPIFDKKG